MSGGIWLTERDADGLVARAKIVIAECANEPPHRLWRGDDTIDTAPKRTHGIATAAFDDGATYLCRPCSESRYAEEARQARLRRLPPIYRDWLAARGIDDWRPR